MRRAALCAGVVLFAAFVAVPAHADIGNFRCTFSPAPAVTLDFHVISSTRVEITYPNGVRVPYGASSANTVQTWRSNHASPVRYEFEISSRLARAYVPIDNAAGLSADEPFDARIRRRAGIPGARPSPKLATLHSAACDALP
jgi:hypothetical protein